MYKEVMMNPNISIEAKAIYAYLSSIAGMSGACYPSIETIEKDLNISKNRLSKHMGQLIASGIVEKSREREGNIYGKNVYKVTHEAEVKKDLKCIFEALQNDSIQKLQNEALENEAIEKLQNEDFRPFNFRALENDTTINNNTNNNNIYIIVEYLNEKAGTHYKASTAKTKSLINARLKEGFTVDDFKTVIDKKVKEWLKDVKMAKYIRPETLFGTKFEGYLNEKGSSCTGATNNRFNNFHQRENNLTDEELEMMLLDNNKKAPQ